MPDTHPTAATCAASDDNAHCPNLIYVPQAAFEAMHLCGKEMTYTWVSLERRPSGGTQIAFSPRPSLWHPATEEPADRRRPIIIMDRHHYPTHISDTVTPCAHGGEPYAWSSYRRTHLPDFEQWAYLDDIINL